MIVSKVWNGSSFVNTDSDTVDGCHARNSDINLYKNVFMSGDVTWIYTAPSTTSRFTIPADIYNPETDIVSIFYNGLRLIKEEQYQMIGYDVVLGFSVATGEKIEFCVMNTSYNYNDLINRPAIGDLGLLTTVHKDTIVGAINEVSSSKATNVPWKNIIDKPLEFPPSTHFHHNIYYTKDQTDAIVSAAKESIDYNYVNNKPSINGVPVDGALTTSQLNIVTMQTLCIAVGPEDWLQDEDGVYYYSLVVPNIGIHDYSVFTPDKETLVNNYKHSNSYIMTQCKTKEVYIYCPFKPDYTISGRIFISRSNSTSSSIVGKAIAGNSTVTGALR